MTTKTAYSAGLDYLHDKLAADLALSQAAPGGVWEDISPHDDSLHTTVVIQAMSLPRIVNAARKGVYSSQLWFVQAVGLATDFANLEAANVRIEALFDLSAAGLTTEQTASAYIEECYIAGERSYSDPPINGQVWKHYGQLIQLGVLLK